jgi:IS1 family transposase
MILKFEEAIATGILTIEDNEMVEDILTSLAEDWNLSFQSHDEHVGYIKIQRFDKFIINILIQLNRKFDKSKTAQFEYQLGKLIEKFKKFEFGVVTGAWRDGWGGYVNYSIQVSREKQYSGRIKLFETFIELEKPKDVEIKPHKKAELIYKDDNLKIYVPKTLDATTKVSDPNWCTNSKSGFYKHNLTANLYRFHFSDGYMLRLTWDYFDYMGDYSGGTHWGQGGIKDGQRAWYAYIRPKDESNPFQFNYRKRDDRRYMVDRIKKIPQKAIDSVYKYQKEHQKEKLHLFNSMYKEVEKIKVIGIEKRDSKKYLHDLLVTILYNNKKYQIEGSDNGWFRFSKDFEKDFKSKYALYDNSINQYLHDKIKEFMKTHKL